MTRPPVAAVSLAHARENLERYVPNLAGLPYAKAATKCTFIKNGSSGNRPLSRIAL